MPSKPHVVAVAQFPPPVTGLSAVNARMVQEIEQAGLLVATADVSPPPNWPSALKTSGRLAKALWASACLVGARMGGARTLYMPCDGGAGLAFNVMLALVGRLLGYRLWTHHHSFAYLNRPSGLMAAFLRFSPKGTTHLILCERMEMLLQEHYPSAWRAGSARAIVLPNAFMTEVAAGPSQTSGDLVLGHLSNLTEDKGALRFLNLFAKLRRKGLAVRAHIAGPAKEPKIRDAITALATEFPDAFRWFGPVYGVEKETFYEGVDVFVFPSAYANEAQPLVLLEALAQGAAVLTTDRGCMGCDHSGSPGAVFNETDFDVEAERWIVNFAADFDRKIAARTATTRFLSLKQEADYALRKVLSTI